jgi:hypothetical protein
MKILTKIQMISLRDVWSIGVVRGENIVLHSHLDHFLSVAALGLGKTCFEAVDIVLMIFILFSKMKHSSPREIKILECVVG